MGRRLFSRSACKTAIGWKIYPLGVENRLTVEVPPGFLFDNHLGKLASHLRMLGFDSYRNDFQDEELAALAESTGRVLLTRRTALADAQTGLCRFCFSQSSTSKAAASGGHPTLRPGR